MQRLHLDLADALARDLKLESDLLKRPAAVALKPEAQLQNLALARHQAGQDVSRLLLEQLIGDGVRRR